MSHPCEKAVKRMLELEAALQQALKNTEGVRHLLAESESGPNCKYCGRDLTYCNCGAGGPCAQLAAENTALRKALEDAPHDQYCHWRGHPVIPRGQSYITHYSPDGAMPCDCWKARIPQPTHSTLEQSSPDGERAGKPNDV